MPGLWDDAVNSVTNTVGQVGAGVSSWLGHGADTSQPVTAATANQHAAAAQPDSLWGRIGQGIGDFGRGVSQEGLGGMLDPAGMMDRQQAQRDLSGRFQVMPDDFVGPKRDNQVSEAEYEKIAHTYSDVRMGRGDLKVNTSSFDGANKDADAARYKQGAMDDVANIMMTSSGRQQIEGLHDNVKVDDKGDAEHTGFMGLGKSFLGPEVHHETDIVPLFGVSSVNPTTGQQTWNDPGAGKHDWNTMRTDNGYADPVDSSKMSRDATTGARGVGTDVNIRFNPEANNIAGSGARSDVILAHEMNHTINETQGTMATGTQTSGPDNGIQNFERQAVGLSRTDSPGGGHFPGDPDGCSENTYRQQRNELGIGERWLPREKYSSLPGQAANDADLQTAWNRQNASGNARP